MPRINLMAVVVLFLVVKAPIMAAVIRMETPPRWQNVLMGVLAANGATIFLWLTIMPSVWRNTTPFMAATACIILAVETLALLFVAKVDRIQLAFAAALGANIAFAVVIFALRTFANWDPLRLPL